MYVYLSYKVYPGNVYDIHVGPVYIETDGVVYIGMDNHRFSQYSPCSLLCLHSS